jgi:hypothetical protein
MIDNTLCLTSFTGFPFTVTGIGLIEDYDYVVTHKKNLLGYRDKVFMTKYVGSFNNIQTASSLELFNLS